MRHPAHTSYLPTLLAIQPDLNTAQARIIAYQAACARTEWSRTDTTEEQTRAFNTIKARVYAAYNRLDLGPTDREKLVKIAQDLRTENTALKPVNERQREQLQHLNAAVGRLTLQEKAA